MKKVILISSHCEDEEKVNVLKQNLIKLNELDIDIILYSTTTLKEEVTKLCTHYYYTKQNPILLYPLKGIGTWRKFHIDEKWITITHVENDYGWAGAVQYKRLLEIAQLLEYDFFYLMIYDLIIDEELISFFKENENTLFFPSRHKGNNKHWNVGSHLIALNLEDSQKFIKELTIENYLSNLKYILENFIGDICIRNSWNVSDKIVEDEINRYVEPFFRNSTENGLKFYYINDTINNFFAVLFFHVEKPTEITLEINNSIQNLKIEKDCLIQIEPIIDKFLLKIDSEEFNFTDKLQNFSYSKINQE